MSTVIRQSVALPAPPAKLYEMYLDSRQHARIIDSTARITRRAGGGFSVWNGDIHGVILQLVPKRLIVQTWRASGWRRSDLDSILILSFHPHGKGGRIELVQANVPDKRVPGVRQGWRDYYWTPWRALLGTP